jgi:hypothetical protein
VGLVDGDGSRLPVMDDVAPEEPLKWAAVGHLVLGEKLRLHPFRLLLGARRNNDIVNVHGQDEHIVPVPTSVDTGVTDTPRKSQ